MPDLPRYPFEALDYGETMEVAPGIHWLRMRLPFALNHINLWLLEDGEAWTIVDTGFNLDDSKEQWRAAIARVCGPRPVRRMIVTHFHPDHIGLAGWFEEEFGAAMWMTLGEYATAHLSWDHSAARDIERWIDFLVANGLDEETARKRRESRQSFGRAVTTVPLAYRRLFDGDAIEIGGRAWQVITGAGHSPEHAALWCPEAEVLISGDQVLPRITTNVSVWYTEPDGDPLRHFLDSLGKFRHIPRGALVLPSHNRPFYGLHERLDFLLAHHAERLAKVLAACDGAKTAMEVLPALFDRALDPHQSGLALGETLAHLNTLVHEGKLARLRGDDGKFRFRRTDAAAAQ